MRIAYNGLFLERPHTGVGQYFRHLLPEIARQMPEDEHVLLVPTALPEEHRTAFADMPNVRIMHVPLPRSLLGYGKALDTWETRCMSQTTREIEADLFHTPYPTPPVTSTGPVVMTVHDTIPWDIPAYRTAWRSRFKLARQKKGMQSATHLLTVSATSQSEIARLTGRPTEDITVTYDGIAADFAAGVTAPIIQSTLAKYQLTRPYLTYFGGYDQRKNVRALVEAFAVSDLAESHDLVLGGALTAPPSTLYQDWYELPALLATLNLAPVVKRPGFVSESDKRAIIAGAAGFLYPSQAEGFGIPILEALALGTPVLASDIPVNRELFESATRLVDTKDTADFAASLQELVTDKASASRSQAAGLKLARQFSWQAAAQKTRAAFLRLRA